MRWSSIRPLDEERVRSLRAGAKVLISGRVYGARDMAHWRIVDLLDAGEQSPIPLEENIGYYVGPAPATPGHVIGAAGPTTSGRMDTLTVPLLARGLRGMIGKGYHCCALLCAAPAFARPAATARSASPANRAGIAALRSPNTTARDKLPNNDSVPRARTVPRAHAGIPAEQASPTSRWLDSRRAWLRGQIKP